ncbi:hypothetical protein BH10ACI3_BH10ACI3_01370 [soil metagenome]
MLYLLDSNILIYAKLDGMAEHKKTSRWLTDAVNDRETQIIISEASILSFLRISTNSKVFDPPLGFDDARAFVDGLLAYSNVQIFKPTAEHFVGVVELMKKHNFGGNLTMDAHLAVMAFSTGAVLVTADKDFKRIPYMKILNPLNV